MKPTKDQIETLCSRLNINAITAILAFHAADSWEEAVGLAIWAKDELRKDPPPPDEYQVVEYAGEDRERIVFRSEDHNHCIRYVADMYKLGEASELGVDIMKNGSTEF